MAVRRLGELLALTACWLLGPAAPALQAQEKKQSATEIEFFEKSVRPVLVAHCFECHGPDKTKGRLRLDSRDMMMHGGESGPAIVPGNAKGSLLIQAIHYKDEPKMPPKAKLSDAEIAVLTTWVQQGAIWPETTATIRLPTTKAFEISAKDREFWSFKPITDPAVPEVKDKSWPKTAIDAFVLATLEANGLEPAAPADRRALLRRVTFDLTGLPPTPGEIDAFLQDESPSAFSKAVDRLLASPQYGERWARHWLDVARYGEDQAHTFQARKYPQGFRYRDWLVRAFNEDMPYDRFLMEQLAADLLPDDNRLENLPALGFAACGPIYYGDPKKLDQIDDRIDTLSRGLLGLTVACARCHDHKYDPISTKDYYSLAGVIASTDYVELSLEPGKEGQPVMPPPKDAAKDKKAPPKGPFIHALKDGSPTTLKVHIRGNPKTLGEDAPRRFLSILDSEHSHDFTKGSGRLELAQAIASKDNPLTARVIVNRVWQLHFGKGLVRTPSNFGILGERPTHPELLDFLASRFMASGWSLKSLHRDIVLSATYQMSSKFEGPGFEIDPDNKMLWRMNRKRLEVEAWRDAMLAVAGTLDNTMGGPPLDLNAADNRRRTLYGFVSRHELNGLLRLFDFPDPNITSEKRTVTTVPLQQLFVLNSEFMVRNAKALAAKFTSQANLTDAERIREAFMTVYGRPATERELALGLAFVSGTPAGGLTRWEQYAQVLLSTNEFLYLD
jgi:cytochrome c553/mono/diheme cytochrome c family protein